MGYTHFDSVSTKNGGYAVGAKGSEIEIIDSSGDITATNATVTNLTVTKTLAAPVAVADGTTYSLLAANSGKIHIMPDLTSSCTISTPTPVAGLNYKIIYGGATEDAQDWVIDTGSDTNYFVGGGTSIDDDDSAVAQVLSDGNSNSIMTIKTPTAGTYVELVSDGTVWYVNALVIGATATGITFADQS